MARQIRASWIIAPVVVAFSSVVGAGDVTSHVPKDAYGFAVVNNLSETSEKIEKLAALFDAPLPPILAYLSRQTGLGEGIDANGQFLVALLPDKKVARYYQLESKIDAVLEYEMARRIPLVQ